MQKKKNSRIGLPLEDKIFYTIINTIAFLLLIIVMYPLIYVLSSSFSSGAAVTSGKVLFLPVDFSTTGYRLVFSYKSVWTGYKNTIINTSIGTIISLCMTIMAAYPLSRRNFQGRQFYLTLFIIPMFISGGIIPSYILRSKLGMVNTRWAVIILGLVTTYNMTIMRTYFQNSIPSEIFDAAQIDGADDFTYLFRIVLPLSKAIIAVIILYVAVGYWNDYFHAMIYLRSENLKTLQQVLREILNANQISPTAIQDADLLAQLRGAGDVMRFSLIVVSTVPLLCAYPFVQKYFEKGVMIGSLKG